MEKTYEDMYKRIDSITKNNTKKYSHQEYKRAKTQLKKILRKN